MSNPESVPNYNVLTPEQVEGFASRPGVKRVAVQNFLGSLTSGNSNRSGAISNLFKDAKQYNWDMATVDAIQAGIYAADFPGDKEVGR